MLRLSDVPAAREVLTTMTTLTTVPRHKTAIRRNDTSRPVKCLLADGLLGRAETIGTRDGWQGPPASTCAALGLVRGASPQPRRGPRGTRGARKP